MENIVTHPYSLYIRRYGRHQNFQTLEDLKEEVSRYFTVREQGIVKMLCTFRGEPDPETHAFRNCYQDFETLYYPADEA